MNDKVKTAEKATTPKVYVAAIDTMIEGKPTRKGVEVKGLEEDKLKAYVSAGLLEEFKPQDLSKEDQALADSAKAIDTTADRRTDK